MIENVLAVAVARVRYARAIRIAYLGNLVAVHFFALAAPVIFKAKHAPMGTLPIFASLPLLWCLRAVIVPPFMRRIDAEAHPLRPVHIVLVTRLILVVLLLLAALATLFTARVARLEALLLGAGAIACVLAGIERGFLDAAAVLSARFQARPTLVRIPVYEAAGVVIGATFSSGLLLAISDQLGVAVCFAVAGGLVALLTAQVPSIYRRQTPTLRDKYGFTDEEVEFFDLHIVSDEIHGERGYQIVLEHANTVELQQRCLKICQIGAQMRLLYTTALYHDYVSNEIPLEQLSFAA